MKQLRVLSNEPKLSQKHFNKTCNVKWTVKERSMTLAEFQSLTTKTSWLLTSGERQ